MKPAMKLKLTAIVIMRFIGSDCCDLPELWEDLAH